MRDIAKVIVDLLASFGIKPEFLITLVCVLLFWVLYIVSFNTIQQIKFATSLYKSNEKTKDDIIVNTTMKVLGGIVIVYYILRLNIPLLEFIVKHLV